jgi:hypothetical protein
VGGGIGRDVIGGTWSIVLGLAAPVEDPPGLRLVWEAPESCPGADDVRAATAELLADTDVLAQTRVHADVRIEARDQGFAMRVRIGDASRELVAPSCDELAATAAFFVAIAIDPRMIARGGPPVVVRRVPPDPRAPEPGPAPAPGPEPAPEPERPEPSRAPSTAPQPEIRDDARSGAAVAGSPPLPSTPGRARGRRPTLVGRVVAGIGMGPSPRTTAAFVASFGLAGRWLRAELEASYWTPRRVASQNNGDVGLVAQLWTTGARGCGVLTRGRVEIPLCAVVHAGLIHAEGEGDLVSRPARVPWVGVGGGVMAIGWLGRRVGLGAGLDVVGSAVRGGFRSVPSGDVDRVDALAIMANCGLFWRHAARREPPALETARAGQPGG